MLAEIQNHKSLSFPIPLGDRSQKKIPNPILPNQDQNRRMKSFRKIATVTGLGLVLQGSLASEQYSREEVLRWLNAKDGFYWSDKLSHQNGRIVASQDVEADEVLMEIPRSAILTPGSDNGKTSSFCMLYNTLVRELDLEGGSQYAPYLGQIQQEQATDMLLPSLWSNSGRRLLELVSMTNPTKKITSVLEDYSHCIDGIRKEEQWYFGDEERDDFGIYKGEQQLHQALEETEEEKRQKLNLALAVKHQIDQKYMVPLYDQLEHHHVSFNVKHQVLKDSSIRVIAVRDIVAGEGLSRPSIGCLEDCDDFGQTNFIETFKNYGVVQSYPHVWTFGIGISLAYHGTRDGERSTRPGELGKVEWIEPPRYEWQLELMKQEHRAQRTEYIEEVVPSRESVAESEWLQINKYCHSLMDALEDIILEGSRLDLIPEEIKDEEDSDDEESEDEDSSDDEDDEDHNSELKDEVGDKIRQKAQEVASRIETQEETSEQAKSSIEGSPWMVKGCDLSDSCNLDAIEDSRKCGDDYEFDAYRNETEWVLMRSAYLAVIGPHQASLNLTYGSGFKVPIKVAHSPGRGRGVFAVEDIPKGTLVWRSEFTATFTEGEQFRRFLAVLPDDMVCDLIIWCYTSMGAAKKNIIECDLDEGSLVNSCKLVLVA